MTKVQAHGKYNLTRGPIKSNGINKMNGALCADGGRVGVSTFADPRLIVVNESDGPDMTYRQCSTTSAGRGIVCEDCGKRKLGAVEVISVATVLRARAESM